MRFMHRWRRQRRRQSRSREIDNGDAGQNREWPSVLGDLTQARGFSGGGKKARQGIRKNGINIQVLLHCEACGAISLVHT